MDFNATVFGQLIFVFALIMGGICYYLGRRKTQSPILAGVIGFALSIIPILGLIYLAVLMFKKDIISASEPISH
ncbi:hypothetical protein [Shewanella sp. MEBiC00475]|uniref:hypothetical protein n=1 Tax=Shewanella sp. MEBiC00475 TaxID=2575361 RepID=UPI0010C0DC5B|nr:hypothetical protein [Shewanella sp. MEBiC00475]